MRKLLLAGLLFLSGCAAASQSETLNACSETSACDSYETAVTEMTEMSFQDAIDFFKEGKSGVLYFGFPDCPWCQEAIPVLEEAAQGKEIYYVRTRDDDRELLYTQEQKEEIIPYIQDYMSDNDEGVLTLYVPLVVNVQEGKAVAGHVGTVDDHDATEREMTEAEKKELFNIYESLLNA
jgi:predicted bacteriocin transport accessory protein